MRITHRFQTVTPTPAVRAGATLTFSLLALTGCAVGAPTATPPESAAASSSAGSTPSPAESTAQANASKETASVSASAQAKASSSATSSSGQTKDFDFEIQMDGDFAAYVPATEDSRATGVPKPIEPKDMNENTEDGFARFATYYMAERNYSITSGDTAKWREMATLPGGKSAVQENQLIDQVDAAYNNGGWVVNGHREIYSDRYMVEPQEDGTMRFSVYAAENGTIILNPDGNPPRTEWVPVTQDAYFYQIQGKYVDSEWHLVGHGGDFNDTIPVS